MTDAALGCMVDVTIVLPTADVDMGTTDLYVPEYVAVGCMQDVSIAVGCMVDVYVAVAVVDPTVYVSVDVYADADADVNIPDVVYVVDPTVYVTVPDAYVQLVTDGCMAGVSSKSSCTAKSFSLSIGVSPSWSL